MRCRLSGCLGSVARLQTLALNALGCSRVQFGGEKFPWLWAGYAGKTTTLTVGCTDCALHAAKFNAAASRFPLMPPSVQPDRRPGDFGIEMEATQNRAWANCCFGSSKAASAMKKCLKGSINSSSCLKEDNLNLETSFPHGEKLVRTRNVRFPCHEELSAK